jgi:SPP1 family predicted phage head-tail adaptor
MNERVTFQKNAVVTDEIGNHVNAWEDFYSCFATIGGEGLASSRESEVAGQTVEDAGMTVTVRFCKKAAEITSTGFRVEFRGELYDITNVDHMNFKRKCLKFVCRKVRR